MTASITRKVSGKITNLAVTRDGMKIKATWKIPSYMTDQERGDRATYLDQDFDFVPLDGSWKPESGEVWNPEGAYPGPPEKTYDFTDWDYYWVKGFGLATTVEKPFKRSRYYPLTSKKVARAAVGVHGGNGLDANGGRGPKVWANYVFQKPRKPVVTYSFDSSNRNLTVTVETDPGKDNKERYDTHIRIDMKRLNGLTTTLVDGNTTSTKWVATYRLSPDLLEITEGNFLTVSVKCYARGIYGDSGLTTKNIYIGMPGKAIIKAITCDKKNSEGRVRVLMKKVSWLATSVQLQRRHGESGSWQNVSGAVDDADCIVLFDSYADANPALGEKMYYRVVSTRDGYTVNGEEFEATALFTAKPRATASATTGIISATTSKDGDSATVVMGWTDSTPNDGTELSWSARRDAWDSVEGPSTAEFAGNGSAASDRYARKRSTVLTGLESGVTYYMRVRRYRTVDGEKVYSRYSAMFSMHTEDATNDSCAIISAEPSSDGTSCVLTIGINENNANTGTELTWATYRNAWESNQQPESLEATWARQSYGVDGWTYSQTIYLRGLEPNTQYFLKARRFLDPVSGSRTYTNYSQLAAFTTPAKGADPDVRCGIVSIEGGADGTSAKVVVGWSGNRTGTELSWSTDEHAWESSVEPSKLQFEWQDDESQSQDWAMTGTAYVYGLTEGVTNYVKARTYYDGDGTVWSDYTADVSVTPFSSPSSVTLTAPAAVARGEAIELYWNIEGTLDQTEWHVHRVGYPFTALAEGEGSLCAATITPERYGDGDSIDLYVEAGCGGGLTASNAVSVGIADIPACEVCAEAEITAQPATFEVVTNDPGVRLLCTCRSLGVTQSAPDGERDQPAGTVVWTDAMNVLWIAETWADTDLRAELVANEAEAQAELAEVISAATFTQSADTEPVAGTAYYEQSGSTFERVEPTADSNPSEEGWYVILDDDEAMAVDIANTALEAATEALEAHPASGACYSTIVTLPESVEFVDGGRYEFSVRAVEQVAGLASDAATAISTVNWAHQAPAPSSSIALTVDSDDLAVTVSLAAPDGAQAGDVYDVYRRTPTGHDLIARGLATDSEVVDYYAPYGVDAELSYRVCTRTADGDIEFADYPYELEHDRLRFDWDGGSASFWINNELSERYEKAFEARAHVDGSVNGYWNNAVTMTGSYSTGVFKLDTLEEVNAARALAEHAGPVFCRTREGMAFECNANVSELTNPNRSAHSVVGLDITRVKLTDEFMAGNGRGGE